MQSQQSRQAIGGTVHIDPKQQKPNEEAGTYEGVVTYLSIGDVCTWSAH